MLSSSSFPPSSEESSRARYMVKAREKWACCLRILGWWARLSDNLDSVTTGLVKNAVSVTNISQEITKSTPEAVSNITNSTPGDRNPNSVNIKKSAIYHLEQTLSETAGIPRKILCNPSASRNNKFAINCRVSCVLG
ncbi:hypothetical protein PIIN_05750 [Serendipita indica DSM 11827]|uniref:Uncharacterized protein n=1 Tax=Serendipita indica (strain DSM 11827) TaxID=1109443 RepID=G4TKH2_SERID|nr:hypothetical protein PIIN_05750 [Serendipita indica DSM 11827]